jgi:hypothetical protein
MLPKDPLPICQGQETDEQRRQRLRAQLLALTLPYIDQLVDTLVTAPDHELFRSVETKAHDLGQQLAAATQQAGLDDRKKGGM